MVFGPGGERVHHLSLIRILNVGSGGVEDPRSRRRDPEQVHNPKLIHGIKHFPWDPARSRRLGSIIESAAEIHRQFRWIARMRGVTRRKTDAWTRNGAMGFLPIAAVIWVGLHLAISGTLLRDVLVQRLGERGFGWAFSLASVAAIGFLARSMHD
jgi:hypothetical protein